MSEKTCGATNESIDYGKPCARPPGHGTVNLPHTTENGLWWHDETTQEERPVPSVTKSTGQYYRKGKCDACGGSVERQKTISRPSYAEMVEAGKRWGETPLLHKKCE